MSKDRKLAANVYVGEKLYEAGTTPPKEIANQITNPKAWGEDASADGADSDGGGKKASKQSSGGSEPANAYDGQSVAKLKAEIKKRNDARDDEATHVKPASQKQADLVAALVADDAAQPAASGE